MSDATVKWIDLAGGRFRLLEWPGRGPGVLFLHGLTGVAEVWEPTVERLGQDRPRSFAFDQRGHGHSAKPRTANHIHRQSRNLRRQTRFQRRLSRRSLSESRLHDAAHHHFVHVFRLYSGAFDRFAYGNRA